MLKKYCYSANIKRVVDGDTMHAVIDVGFTIHLTVKIRLYGIDCPEANTTEGKQAANFVKALLEGQDVELEVIKQDSFGRWLVNLYRKDFNFNEDLVRKGYAKPYKP